ncbi:nuclear transport factor 2 family protein [Streptomyces sp. NPDC005262]|uniref:nuclear transport factor 2 family protein n=1 Tax=Streptomyces sp. NPDC005262 TaxID=3364710 RepID=UPI0036993E87
MSDTRTATEIAAANRELARKFLIGELGFELFADDVVLEFPYGPSLGMPDRFEGKEVAVTYLTQMLSQLQDLQMRDVVSHSVDADPNTVINEYEGDAVTKSGKAYTQIYMNKMRFRDGKLVLFRELWDPMRVAASTDGAYEGNVTA